MKNGKVNIKEENKMSMTNWSDYQREEIPRIEEGDHRVEIINVEETYSRNSGNPMLVITLVPNASKRY